MVNKIFIGFLILAILFSFAIVTSETPGVIIKINNLSKFENDPSYLTSVTAADVNPGNFPIGDYSFDTNTLFIDSNSNKVGIGTISPNELLHIGKSAGNDDVALMIENTAETDDNNDAALMIKNQGGTWTFRNLRQEVGDLAMLFGSTEIMRLESTGNVGIGTASPSTILHLGASAPQLRFDSASTDWQIDVNSQLAGGFIIRDVTNSRNLMTLTNGGNIGINTITPQNLLNVLGDANITGDLYAGNINMSLGLIYSGNGGAYIGGGGDGGSRLAFNGASNPVQWNNVGEWYFPNLAINDRLQIEFWNQNATLQIVAEGGGTANLEVQNNITIRENLQVDFDVNISDDLTVNDFATFRSIVRFQNIDGSKEAYFKPEYNFQDFRLGVSSTLGRQFIIGDTASIWGRDFDHPIQNNPTLFIHSSTDANTNNTQWVSLTHDKTNAVLDVGSGLLNISSDVIIEGNLNITTLDVIGDTNITGLIYGNGSQLTNLNHSLDNSYNAEGLTGGGGTIERVINVDEGHLNWNLSEGLLFKINLFPEAGFKVFNETGYNVFSINKKGPHSIGWTPFVSDSFDLGTDAKRWKNLYLSGTFFSSSPVKMNEAIKILGTDNINLTINGTHLISTSGMITTENLTANYYFGNGSQLTDLITTESDPLAYNGTLRLTTNETFADLETTDLNVTGSFTGSKYTWLRGADDEIEFTNTPTQSAPHFTRYRNGNGGVNFFLRKAQGTPSTPLYVGQNNVIGQFNYRVWNEAGNDWSGNVAQIAIKGDKEHSSGNFPTNFLVKLTKPSESSSTNAMIITSDLSLQTFGGRVQARVFVTSDITLTGEHYIVFISAFSGDKVVTLPHAGVSSGRVFIISKVNDDSNIVTIKTFQAGQTIGGQDQYNLTIVGESIMIQSDGAINWAILSSNTPVKAVTTFEGLNITSLNNSGETTFLGQVHHLIDNIKTYWGASNDISFEFNGSDFIENVEAGIVSKFITGYVKSIFDHDVEIQGDLNVTGTIKGTIDMFPFMVHQSTAYLTNLTNTTETVNCGTPIINSSNYNSTTTQITISESGIYGISYSLGILLDTVFGGPRTRLNTSMQYSNGTEVIGSKAFDEYEDFWEGTGMGTSFLFNNSGEQTLSLLISAALGTQGIDATVDDCQISIVRYGKQ